MAKKSSNDSTIIALKKQISDKKAALKGIDKFAPATNCSIVLDGVRTNIHTLGTEDLTLLLVKLNSLRLSAEDLKVDPLISGHTLSEWLGDIKSKLLIANRKQEEARLKLLEAKLTDLLSAEKKTELLLEEIAGEL